MLTDTYLKYKKNGELEEVSRVSEESLKKFERLGLFIPIEENHEYLESLPKLTPFGRTEPDEAICVVDVGPVVIEE